MPGMRGCLESCTCCRGAEDAAAQAAALAGALARLQELTQLKLDLGGNDELGRGPQSKGAWS